MEMGVGDGVLAKLSRQFYAVFCLGVVLISAVIAHQYYPSQSLNDDQLSTHGRRQHANRRPSPPLPTAA
ncbi:hypothetical protein C2S52_016550 [Perilla frutescens var. hirtella]|uniref:Uncharacterized protein n=1 Tax=Perilla frutescens var. hirtella TaxID=608512 RepID=A0AAD4JP27_PERFH|nr:hypothetical protein C2S52_016550 [Perilla frutescens var. hirtella]KAH6810408.1 hypothetical protein C2S51_024170 [Perilla frutescens var. frutescens]KAH6836523.1 hypothetical protein C2S53_005142 [Perilla frutescens var. hirtella]